MKASESIKRIKGAGFHFLKLEFEAEVDYSTSVERECQDCGGSGCMECAYCDGRGAFDSEDADGNPVELSCDDCVEGTYQCYECEGSGTAQSELDDYELVVELGSIVKERFVALFAKEHPDISNPLPYFRAYVDGSVNTEITFTVPIEVAKSLPKLLSIFHDVCNESGGYETENAGMHMTLLPNSSYPIDERLPQRKISNFHTAMQHFIPYLYPLATDGGTWTRELGYRKCEISDESKYSAIYTHRDTCIEYRIFDTCYSRPDRVLSFLGVIARTLQFYVDILPPRLGKAVCVDHCAGGEMNEVSETDYIPSMLRHLPNKQIRRCMQLFIPRKVYKQVQPILTQSDSYESKEQALTLIAAHS